MVAQTSLNNWCRSFSVATFWLEHDSSTLAFSISIAMSSSSSLSGIKVSFKMFSGCLSVLLELDLFEAVQASSKTDLLCNFASAIPRRIFVELKNYYGSDSLSFLELCSLVAMTELANQILTHMHLFHWWYFCLLGFYHLCKALLVFLLLLILSRFEEYDHQHYVLYIFQLLALLIDFDHISENTESSFQIQDTI